MPVPTDTSLTRREDAKGPLSGLTILDLTTVIMGPYATAMLADLGAAVVKVESPEGDMTRRVGRSEVAGFGPLTLNLQRGKRSVVLDLSDKSDRARLDVLIDSADALVTNLRPRSREKLGLTYERLSAVRPDIVFCTAQAYSSESSRADEPAYDDIVQAASGFAMIPTLAGAEPAYTPSVIADKVSAFAINQALLAALWQRERTGVGQWVDVPMVDSLISFNLVEHLFQGTRVENAGNVGWTRVLSANRKPMRTADQRWVCLLPYSDSNWQAMFEIIARPDLKTDERTLNMNARNANMDFLLGVLGEAAGHKSADQWMKVCERNGIPACELLDLRNAHLDPYIRERGIMTLSNHPAEGAYWALPLPIHFSVTPTGSPGPAPALGADTSDIFSESPGNM